MWRILLGNRYWSGEWVAARGRNIVNRLIGAPSSNALTPFMWFIMTMCVIGLVVAVVLIVNGISSSQHRSVTLDERLAELQKISPTSFALTAAAQAPTSQPVATSVQTSKVAVLAATATPRPSPTQTPVPTPTLNPNDAPWANQLIQQPDRTLLAPQAVVDKATADLSAYYTHLQNLSLDDFLRERYDLLARLLHRPGTCQYA